MTLAAASTQCFTRARLTPACVAIDASGLTEEVALALAMALPFLRCGEESAIHAFGRRLMHSTDPSEQLALAAITADEQRHAAWLEALAVALPVSPGGLDAEPLARFFRSLLTRDKAQHFARIAALDLAVCALLHPLVGGASVLASAPQVIAGLRSIRRDEARHVRVARRCAQRLGWSLGAQTALDRTMRDDLAALLAPVHASLQRLGIVGFGVAAHA